MADSTSTSSTPLASHATINNNNNLQFLLSLSAAAAASSNTTPQPHHNGGSENTDIKNMTIQDLLNIVNNHHHHHHQSEPKLSKLPPPPKHASLEEKVQYALSELECTQNQIAESKMRYQTSITSLQRATLELQHNNQILLQNKFEIQENKIESQRTRIELNSLKQQTVDEIKNLNKKIDLLLNNYTNNFNTLHQTVINTLSKKKETFHKPKSVAPKKSASSHSQQQLPPQQQQQQSSATPEGSPFRSGTDDLISTSEFRYKLAKPLTNVRQIWEEYEYGLYGQPSVKSLDQKFKNRWRYKGENTTYLRRRKIFILIENCIKIGISENDAIDLLEKLRVDETGTKRTMAWLFDNIPEGFPETYFGIEKPADGDIEMADEEEDAAAADDEPEEEEEEEELIKVEPAEGNTSSSIPNSAVSPSESQINMTPSEQQQQQSDTPHSIPKTAAPAIQTPASNEMPSQVSNDNSLKEVIHA